MLYTTQKVTLCDIKKGIIRIPRDTMHAPDFLPQSCLLRIQFPSMSRHVLVKWKNSFKLGQNLGATATYFTHAVRSTENWVFDFRGKNTVSVPVHPILIKRASWYFSTAGK